MIGQCTEDHCQSKSSGGNDIPKIVSQSRAVCRNCRCRGISQGGKEKPLRLKSPDVNSLLASQTPEKDEQEASPHELSLVTQTCEASGPSNVHSCREDGVRMNEGTLPLEEACGGMEDGQPSEEGERAAPDSREAHLEAQEEERRKRWEEEDEDEQAAWLAMRGSDETFEEELELTKEEISRLLQGQYRDALKHVRGKTISLEYSLFFIFVLRRSCRSCVFFFRSYDIQR